MTDITSLRAAIRTSPDPVGCRLALADALTEDGQELAAAHMRVLAQPDVDGWRLALADYFERVPEVRIKCEDCDEGWRPKSGVPDVGMMSRCPACVGGTIPDPTPKQRSELLRVQCELERFREFHPEHRKEFNDAAKVALSKRMTRLERGESESLKIARAIEEGGKMYDRRCHELQDRQRELLAALTPTLPPCPQCNGMQCEMGPKIHQEGCKCCSHCSGSGRVGTYSRGVVEEVRVPRLEDVLEQVDREFTNGADFPAKWQPTAWARQLFRDHPCVLRVECGDVDPQPGVQAGSNGKIRYYVGDYMIPQQVFGLMGGATDDTGVSKGYDTHNVARLTLSVAVADCLREMLESE